MKVLDLRCEAGHAFEGWFGSETDYEQQRDAGRIECPSCGSARLSRLPSAPRLNLSGAKAPSREQPVPAGDIPSPLPGATPPASPAASPVQQFAAHLARAVDELVRNTEDVGARFPEEARRIHYGEVPPKGIRGQATPEERAALQEEGIETLAIPVPLVSKGTLQ